MSYANIQVKGTFDATKAGKPVVVEEADPKFTWEKIIKTISIISVEDAQKEIDKLFKQLDLLRGFKTDYYRDGGSFEYTFIVQQGWSEVVITYFFKIAQGGSFYKPYVSKNVTSGVFLNPYLSLNL